MLKCCLIIVLYYYKTKALWNYSSFHNNSLTDLSNFLKQWTLYFHNYPWPDRDSNLEQPYKTINISSNIFPNVKCLQVLSQISSTQNSDNCQILKCHLVGNCIYISSQFDPKTVLVLRPYTFRKFGHFSIRCWPIINWYILYSPHIIIMRQGYDNFL